MATDVYVTNTVDVDVDGTVDVDVNGTVDVDVNGPVDAIAVVTDLPPVQVAVLPDIRITDIGPVGPVTLAGIPSNYTVAISNLPDVNVRIREIPSIRAHIPANFRLGFSVFGVELAALHLCGEAQIITEPYVPNPCERCGPARQIPPQGQQPPSMVGAVLRLADNR